MFIGEKMSEYTLNEIKFNPGSLTLCPAGQGDNADKEENKELMEQLVRQFNERKLQRQRII